MYCAMIGDLINSKKLPAEDRAAIQERLKALLNGVFILFGLSVSHDPGR